MEEHETISGEDAKRILKGEKMVDCYNVQALKKTEDDQMDEEVFASRFPPKEEKEKSPVEKRESEREEYIEDMAKRMLRMRQKEEEEIFEILLKEDLAKKKEEQKKE